MAEPLEVLLAWRRHDVEYGSIAPSARDANLDWEGLVLGALLRF